MKAKKVKNNMKSKKLKTNVKVGNKAFNRLVKRGKAKPKSTDPYLKWRKDPKKGNFRFTDVDECQEEFNVNDVMDMLPEKELKKLAQLSDKRKLDDNSDDESDLQLEEYEKVPRVGWNDKSEQQVKRVKLESNSETLSEEDNEENDGNSEESVEPIVEDKPDLLIDILGGREQLIAKLKDRVGTLSTAIISSPEKNVKKLKELILLLDFNIDDNSFKLAFITIQKLISFATLEVFKDIIPNYRVVEKANRLDDNKRKLKKETKLLWDYERTLVQLYKLYIHRLERMVNCVRKKSAKNVSNFYDKIVDNRKAKEKIAMLGLKCLSELLLTHPQFNCRITILQIVVSLTVSSKLKDISDFACETLTKLYKQDKVGDISLEAVKVTVKTIKASGFNVNPKVISTFLSLKIKEVKKKDEYDKKNMKMVRGKLEMMSRKEKKRNKQMHKLENQLLETEAQANQKKKLEYHTEILSQIFTTYFRILKFNLNNIDDELTKQKFKLVLTPVLEGLSKFAHLINIEFFDNIIAVVYKLMREEMVDCHQSLHCLKTVFTILSGEGSALNIDPQRFYAQLYTQLNYIDSETCDDTVETLLECMDAMIIKRRKDMSLPRVLAFLKRLTTTALNSNEATTLAFFSLIVLMMRNHKQSDILLDNDKCGSGVYSPEVEDPEFSNANASNLWELHLLRKHHFNSIRNYANCVITNFKKGNPVDGTPIEVFHNSKSSSFCKFFRMD